MKKKIISISQSNYIPWVGYFEIIKCSDIFIFLDEVQFTRRDWRNRNRLLVNKKIKWLTLDVKNKGNFFEKINKIEIKNIDWARSHLNLIKEYYKKSEHFDKVYPILQKIYLDNKSILLSEINQNIIIKICELLKFKTKFKNSIGYKSDNIKNISERILDICIQNEATDYITGPKAKQYLNIDVFKKANINVRYFDYNSQKKYQQLSNEFIPKLSIIDALLNCGFNSSKFLNY